MNNTQERWDAIEKWSKIKDVEKQAVIDCDKLDKIILSCKNKNQLKTAFNYYKLWRNKYNDFIFVFNNPGFNYRDGKACGMLILLLNQFKNDTR